MAVWGMDKTLLRAGYIETEEQHLGLLSGRIITTIRDTWGIDTGTKAHAVVELPQVYDRTKSKARPQDLIKLATVSGACAALYHSYEFVLPFTWKGDMPKEVVQNRLHRPEVAGGLPSYAFMRMEPCPKGVRHNVYDGLGIGWWWFGQHKK